MKASHLTKTSESIDNIYNGISCQNAEGHFKYLIPHFVYVSDEVKLQLIEDGYKVHFGEWNGFERGLIIEW